MRLVLGRGEGGENSNPLKEQKCNYLFSLKHHFGRSAGYIPTGPRQHSHSWLHVSSRYMTKIFVLS
jgi:hypothetical protein